MWQEKGAVVLEGTTTKSMTQEEMHDHFENKVVSVFSQRDLRRLEGKLLTINDAVITDTAQRKAVKDIIQQAIWGWADELPIHEKATLGKDFNTRQH